MTFSKFFIPWLLGVLLTSGWWAYGVFGINWDIFGVFFGVCLIAFSIATLMSFGVYFLEELEELDK